MYRISLMAPTQSETLEPAAVLRRFGYNCEHATTLANLETQRPEVVLLVAMEPAQITAFTETRHEYLDVPVLALVDATDLPELNSGIKMADFMTWPGSEAELRLRLERICAHHYDSPDVQLYGALSINRSSCEVRIDGIPVMLTFKEYELLKYFAENTRRVLSRTALLNHVWGYDYLGGDRTVDVHVRRLRAKIESSGHDYIDTVRNVGYRFQKKSEV